MTRIPFDPRTLGPLVNDPRMRLDRVGPESIDPNSLYPVPATPNTTTLDPLTTAFPASKTYAGGWASLAVNPTTIPHAIPAGQHAFLRLLTLTPDKGEPGAAVVGQEFVLSTVELEMVSIDAAGGGTFTAWGSVQGIGGALVVARNLPGRASDAAARIFRAGPCPLPYLAAPAIATPNSYSNFAGYIWSQKFPAGAYTASPQSQALNKDWPPFVERFTYGDTLGVAFVLNGATATAIRALGAAANIQGLLNVRVKVGLVASARPPGI